MPTCTFCDAEVSANATRCPACGAEQPARSNDESQLALEEELHALLGRGDKIKAIKRYRDATGVGLAEAKDVVEAFERAGSLEVRPTASPAMDTDLETAVLNAFASDGKIAAIKIYRERTKVGLKEAKDAVEAIAIRHGVVAKGTGCAGMMLLMVLALAAVIATT